MSAPDAAFYFDLGSPLAYLAAERVLQALPGPCEWQPVLAGELGGGAEKFEGFRCREDEEIFRLEVERRAHELGLQELRWPEPFPFDSALVMRAATYAKSIGRTVPFAQAAFRQAFAGGRSLAELDNVLIAAAACEMHPAAVRKAIELGSIAEQLSGASAAAAAAGVADVPAMRIGARVFHGERGPEDAALHARREPGTGDRTAGFIANPAPADSSGAAA
ncbi:MAG TPA: DsbA family protein [Solirubrobacteraceae bacterium]|jgi:2-hydroxychromene-2-carboxylate isomerase|nr:DsbA family protein [Solirubrobacteraceae bacterium]